MTTIVEIMVACKKLTPLEKKQRDLINNLMSSEEGRKELSAFMAPARRRRDYQALGRSLFPVQPLPPGALPTYPKVQKDDDGEA